MIDLSPAELIAAARHSLERDVQPLLAASKREGGTMRACLAVLAYAETLLAGEGTVLAEDSADMRALLASLDVSEAPLPDDARGANRLLRRQVSDLYRQGDLSPAAREQLRALVLRQSDRDYSLLQPVEALPPI